jgi:hypothetical protein
MNDVASSLHARNAAIERLREELSQTEEDVLAIELCDASDEQRQEDRALVRQALDEGQSPSDIGALFVAVIADLTYDVDWGDQFQFWPLLHQRLGSDRLRLTDNNEDRRRVAAVYKAFASKGNVAAPRGAFAEQFPLMSWPLVHAGLPRCAHRPMARLIERATARGILSAGSNDWPADEVLSLGARTGVPLFLQGLLEHPGVSKRIGSSLLDAASGERSSGWLRRLAEDIHADGAVKDCLDAAKKRLERPRAGRTVAAAQREPTRAIVLERVADAYQLNLEIGPLEADLQAIPELEDFAEKYGALRVRCSGTTKPGGFLVNALHSRITQVLPWKGGALLVEIEATPYDGSSDDVPQKIRNYFVRAKLEQHLPALFRPEAESRLVLSREATQGEEVVVILQAGDTRAAALHEAGFIREKLVPEAQVVVLRGLVSGPVAKTLAALGFSVSPPRVSLHPVLVPPVIRERSRFVYAEGQDAWLSVEGLPGDVEARAMVRSGSTRIDVEMKRPPHGAPVVRVPARNIQAQRSRLEIVDDTGTALSSVELVARAAGASITAPPRWHAVLNPLSASLEQFLAGMCWLEVEALPGVHVEVEIVAPGSVVIARHRFVPPVSLFDGARQLQTMVEELDSAEQARIAAGEALIVRARAADEPGALREIARLGPAKDPLRFEPNGDHLVLVSEEGADTPELWRLTLEPHGAQRTQASPSWSREPGIYVGTSGEDWAAACIADGSSSLPKTPRLHEVRRGRDRCLEILRLLRAVDVARLWPKASLGRALFARRRAAVTLERELVATLCGLAWARREEEAAQQGLEGEELLKAFAPMLWINPDHILGELDVVDDPISSMDALLPHIGARSNADRKLAKHLLLVFYQRGMATRGLDRECIEWAWASVQRARLVRLCFLAVQDPFQRANLSEPLDEDGDG